MADKKAAKKNAKIAETASGDKAVMLTIPEANLRLVYEWIEDANMSMPHNQVVRCLQLLATAKVVED